MNTLLVQSVILVLASSCLVISIKVNDCGSVGATVNTVDVDNCDAAPCKFIRGKNASMHLNFSAKENVKLPTNVLHGIIAGISVPFPVEANSCTNGNIKCPVVSGATATYNITIPILSSYPKVQVIVKLELKDDDKKDFLCILFPAVIADSSH